MSAWVWFDDLHQFDARPLGRGACQKCGRDADLSEREVWSADLVEFPAVRLCADCGGPGPAPGVSPRAIQDHTP